VTDRLGAHARAIGLIALAGLCGCRAVGPDYTPPKTDMPALYANEMLPGTTQGARTPDEAIARWWTLLDDPALTVLIERALAANHDVRLATARLREARAILGITESDLLPSVDASGSASRSQFSDRTNQGFGPTGEQNFFRVGLDASWEIDVFGGVRRSVEAAGADAEAAAENRAAVWVSLAAEVALNYIELRSAQQRIAVTDKNIHAQGETLDLTRSRASAGLAAELEVAQAQSQLALRRAQRPPLVIAERAAAHRLGVLLGVHPESVLEELSRPAPLPASTADIAIGIPSDLLRRRPDIRAAERRIAGATARIGVATADLFPRFSLTGSFGFETEELDGFGYSDSRAWSVGPAVRFNLFDRSRTRRAIEAASAREEQALILYEQTVLQALEETENTLVRLAQERLRASALRDAVDASERAVAFADERYRSGVGDFLNVLESQRLLYDAEDQLVQSSANETAAIVSLFKALGGGWDAPPEEAAPEAATLPPTPEDPGSGGQQ